MAEKRFLKITHVPYYIEDGEEAIGKQYEIMWESDTHWTLWGETEDGGWPFQFPKEIIVKTGKVIKWIS